jgi:hypothetical protein
MLDNPPSRELRSAARPDAQSGELDMRSHTPRSIALLAVGSAAALVAGAAGTATAQVQQNDGPTYQGRLNENGQPANGIYDIRITPTNPTGFTSTPTTHTSVEVIDGVFTIPNAFVVSNSDFYNQIRIEVRPAGSTQSFTVLSPNQPVSPVPFSSVTRGILVDPDSNVGVGLVRIEPVARLHVADDDRVLVLSPAQSSGGEEPTNDVVSIGFFDNFPLLSDSYDASISYFESGGYFSFAFDGMSAFTIAPNEFGGSASFAGEELGLFGINPKITLAPQFPSAVDIPLSSIAMGSVSSGGQADIDWFQNSDRLIFSSPQGSSQGIQMRLDTGSLGINTDPNDLGAALAVASDLAIVAVESTSGSPSRMNFSAVGLSAEARLTFDPNPSRPSFSIDLDETGGIPFADFIVEGGQISMLNGLVYISDLSLNVAESARDNDDLIISQSDATLGLYSSTLGTFGSQITFKEISGTSLTNNWGIIRETSSFGASLQFRYGSDANSGFNTLILELDPVEGSLRLGGAAATVSDYRLVLPNSATGGGRAVANRWDTYSSARFKTNIATIANPLVTLAQLRGVTFDWLPEHAPLGGAVHDLGFIAEEVAAVLPDAVSTDAQGHAEALDYSRLLPIAIEAIKQQQATITSQQAEIDALNQRMQRLEKMLDR